MKWVYFSLIFLFGNFISACQATHIHLHGTIHKPYCGGAKPTPLQAEGNVYSAAGMSLDLFCVDQDDNKKVERIILDDNGLWKGTLKKGQYILKQADKGLSLTALKVKYHLNDTLNYKYIGDKKLDQWTKETDFVFIVVASDTLRKDFVLKEKCFVGLNPCFEYIGQKPR